MLDDDGAGRGPSRQPIRIVVGAAAALVVATALWLLRWHRPLGRDGWYITPNATPWPLPAWWLPISVLLIFGGGAALSTYDRFHRSKTRREQNVSTTLCVVMLTVLGFLWPFALLGPYGAQNLINSTFSDVSNEYFGTAYGINDARLFTRQYAVQYQQPTSTLRAHVATHPPGAVLFYYGARRLLEATPALQARFEALAAQLTGEELPDVIAEANRMRRTAARAAGSTDTSHVDLPPSATACALWSAFLIGLLLASVVPATFFAAAAGPDRDSGTARGIIAASLAALAPSAALFAFSLDGVIAAGVAWTLALATRRLAGGSPAWLAGAGAVLALTGFVSIGALAAGAMVFLALAIRHGARRGFNRDLACFAAGFLLAGLLLLALFPMQPLTIVMQALSAHQFATLRVRTYAGWLVLNPLVFALFAGWPVAVAALIRLARLRCGGPLDTATLLGVATAATIVVLDVSGNVRGEVERLWMFLVPPLCLLAASGYRPSNGETAGEGARRPSGASWWVGLIVLQAVQTLLMAANLAPLVLPFGFDGTPTPNRLAAPQAAPTPP